MHTNFSPLSFFTLPKMEEKKGLDYGWCFPLALSKKASHLENRVIAFVARIFSAIADYGTAFVCSIGYNFGAVVYNLSLAPMQNFFIERRNAQKRPILQRNRYILGATALIAIVCLGLFVRHAFLGNLLGQYAGKLIIFICGFCDRRAKKSYGRPHVMHDLRSINKFSNDAKNAPHFGGIIVHVRKF